MVRFYPSRPSKFYNRACYVRHQIRAHAVIFTDLHFSYSIDEKNSL